MTLKSAYSRTPLKYKKWSTYLPACIKCYKKAEEMRNWKHNLITSPHERDINGLPTLQAASTEKIALTALIHGYKVTCWGTASRDPSKQQERS